jgi:hypothetical protein
MHRASLTVIAVVLAIPLILLAAATVAISSTVSEDAFARDGGRYSGDSTRQAAAVNNDCLNPIFDSNEDIDKMVGVGNCGGTVSQQDESGSASAPKTSQTANPTIELQRATSQPGLEATTTCEGCFNDLLTPDEINRFLSADSLGGLAPSIDELCTVMRQAGDDTVRNIIDQRILPALAEIEIDDETIGTILDCLNDVFGLS